MSCTSRVAPWGPLMGGSGTCRSQETRELELRSRPLVYGNPVGATVLNAPMQVQMSPMAMYPGIQMAPLAQYATAQPTHVPPPVSYATVAPPMPPGSDGVVQGVVAGPARGQPVLGGAVGTSYSASSSAGGQAETLEQFVTRLGLPPSVAEQLRDVGVRRPEDMADVDERRLDSAGLKPAFKAVLLRNWPGGGGGEGRR